MNANEIKEAFLQEPGTNVLGEKYPAVLDLCCSIAANDRLLTGLQFANDYLSIPPVQSLFTGWSAELHNVFDTLNTEDTHQLDQQIGRFFGFVFQIILGYEGYDRRPVEIAGFSVTSAALFQPPMLKDEVQG